VRRAAVAIALIGLLALCASATAATLEVQNTDETGPGSLGDTILRAGPGDTIKLGPGTYPLTEGETLIAQGNIIEGAGVGVTTIVPTGGGEALNSSNVVDATIAPAKNPKGEGSPKIETKAQIIALLATVAIFLLILELVRRRRLAERYALLWMLAAIAMLVLAIWTDGLSVIADAMGIQEPANAIFIIALGVIFILLLHFSVATTRLADETKILAQENARLDLELREASAGPDEPADQPPVATQDRG
jgi:hypothetical protein